MDIDANFSIPDKSSEKVDDLFWRNLKIIQNPNWFCFSLDAVLLAYFSSLKKNDIIADLGSGNGILPLLLWGKNPHVQITGLEIVPQVADLARRSIALNKLEKQINIITGDLKEATTYLDANSFNVVISNPPYLKQQQGRISPNLIKAYAKTELTCTLKDVIKAASLLLKSQGSFYMVHRPNRLPEILNHLDSFNLAPKTLRFVHTYHNQPANLLLIEAIADKKCQLNIAPPLIVYENADNYSPELKKLFNSYIIK